MRERRSDSQTDGLRAALLGVYTEAQFGPGFGAALPAAMRPLSIGASVERMLASTSPYQRTAWFMSVRRLAWTAVRRDGDVRPRSDLDPYLFACVGREKGEAIIKLAPESPFHFSQGLDRILFGTSLPGEEGGTEALGSSEGTFDPSSRITTATAVTSWQGDFARLAVILDPRSWSRESIFFPESYEAIQRNGQFQPDPAPPPPGQSWKGYLYEFVESRVNDAVSAAFQNYLNVDFKADYDNHRIRVDYSLYSCQGSMLLERIAGGGIEVDSGFAIAEPLNTLPSVPPEQQTFKISAKKTVRFADTVSRSTPNQGPSEAGQMMNLLAPAVVSMWLDASVSSLPAISSLPAGRITK
jgi:hypothetical protein